MAANESPHLIAESKSPNRGRVRLDRVNDGSLTTNKSSAKLSQRNGMKVALRQIYGPWSDGWVLDKHSVSSTYVGEAQGRPQFDTIRTDVGQATYLLKYQQRWEQAEPLAQALFENICPKFDRVGFIVPMPATTNRPRQPVTEVAKALGRLLNVPVFTNVLRKAQSGQALKDLHTKEAKAAAIGDSFSINDQLTKQGKWNVLLVDDLYHTGASMDAACKSLSSYSKVKTIYVACLTWK
jgi:hypothetical protein